MKKILLVGLFMIASVGCGKRPTALDKLLGDYTSGTPYVPPHGRLAESNVVPFYDQPTATNAEDDNLILKVIGTPGTAPFNAYCANAWLPDRMNGIDNSGLGTGTNSILVDAWKALYRRGFIDISKLHDPVIIHSNIYPIAVYQGVASDFNL